MVGGLDPEGGPVFVRTHSPQGVCPARPGSATTLASITAASATGMTWQSSLPAWCTTGTLSLAR